jgi:hypothetical protein
MTSVRQAGNGQPRGVPGADEVPAAPASPDRQPDASPAAAARLLRACSARGWTITHHDELRYWTAERASKDGTHIRFIAARSPAELAARLAAAESGQ